MSLRLGSIEFINSLPVDLGLISGKVPCEAEIITGIPTALNEKILTGSIDVSAVSALFYAEHQDKFLLLPDLSISSESGVESVLLFSRYPMKHLKARQIAITRQGRTTPALLEILCRQQYGFRPDLKIVSSQTEDIPADEAALLLIGDNALKAKESLKTRGYHVIDLAEEWRNWTSLPFVFAVWVVRRDVFISQPKKIADLHLALLSSKKWGTENLQEILNVSEKKTGLSAETLKRYFLKLSYDFSEGLKCGLKLYLEHSVRCGILPSIGELESITQRPQILVS